MKAETMVRAGAAQIVEVFAIDVPHILEAFSAIATKVRERYPASTIETYTEWKLDEETGEKYLYGLVVYERFLDKWAMPQEFEPDPVIVIDVKESI